MRFGISLSTYNTSFGPVVFRSGRLADNLTTIEKLGYGGVDLFIDRKSAHEIDEIRNLFKQTSLEIAMYIGIFMAEMGVNLSCADPVRRKDYLALYKSQIDVAQYLEGQRMPIGNIRGAITEADTEADFQERLADSLHELCSYAEERGITLCLEPTNRYECNTLNQVHACVEFIENYHLTRLGLLLDNFHMNIEDASITGAILEAGARIQHFHCPDSNRTAAGTGHLDYISILRALKATGYQGYLMLEAFPKPDALTCASTSLAYLQQKLDELDQPGA
jgi:sugar phosphate isomerase/epimerase